MKATDYSKIAPTYDDNPIRNRWNAEPAIGEVLTASAAPIRILDLACGTGNFLFAQRAAFPTERITWFGCDMSEAMLGRARAKLMGVELKEVDAAALPYAAGFFNVVTGD